MRVAFLPVILSGLLLPACSTTAGTGKQVDTIVEPFNFSITNWEIEALSREYDQWLFGARIDATRDAEAVREYFENILQIQELENRIQLARDGIVQVDIGLLLNEIDRLAVRNITIRPVVEQVLAAQIETVLVETGIINPSEILSSVDLVFPPVNFVIQPPPHLLVISPRDSITRLKDITLVQEISDEDKEAIEQQIAGLGLSALVVSLGGIATYPAFVAEVSSLQYVLEIAVEEWFHQYLIFKPLGFRYGLHIAGIQKNYEVATANEALTGMASREIAGEVYRKYYSGSSDQEEKPTIQSDEFDYYAEMRKIRIQVDALLAEGKVEEAEDYMEQKRLFLAANGYVIRKINQAFFAFYGTYADSPSSVSPIGKGLRVLRQQSSTLKEFVEKISTMTDVKDIIEAAG